MLPAVRYSTVPLTACLSRCPMATPTEQGSCAPVRRVPIVPGRTVRLEGACRKFQCLRRLLRAGRPLEQGSVCDTIKYNGIQSPYVWVRERSQGGILAGGDLPPGKYNRLPLDAVTRCTLIGRGRGHPSSRASTAASGKFRRGCRPAGCPFQRAALRGHGEQVATCGGVPPQPPLTFYTGHGIIRSSPRPCLQGVVDYTLNKG